MADAAEPEGIGQRIRRLRLERGLSQRELAEPGISYAYLSRIEAGQRNPSLKALRVVARKLGVSPDYLETGERVSRAAERELRLIDAELALRMGGDLERAEPVFEEEATRETDADAVFEARAHAGLGLIASMRGHSAEAIKHLGAATESGYFPPETRPDLYRALGHAYISAGASTKAVELFEFCSQRVRQRAPDDAGLQIKFAVYAASAYSTLGESGEVRRVLSEATERAESEAATSPIRINLYWALARAAWAEADSDAAFGYIYRAIGLLESSEDTYNLALAHLLAAQMLALETRGDEADLHLSLAERLLVLRGDTADLGLLRAEQAKRAAANGHGEEAMRLAAEAMRLVRDHAPFLGAAQHALAVARVAAGNPKKAEHAYRAALKTLEGRSQWREASAVARDLAKLVRAAGRDDEAFELLDHATTLSIRQTRQQPLGAQ